MQMFKLTEEKCQSLKITRKNTIYSKCTGDKKRRLKIVFIPFCQTIEKYAFFRIYFFALDAHAHRQVCRLHNVKCQNGFSHCKSIVIFIRTIHRKSLFMRTFASGNRLSFSNAFFYFDSISTNDANRWKCIQKVIMFLLRSFFEIGVPREYCNHSIMCPMFWNTWKSDPNEEWHLNSVQTNFWRAIVITVK